jgi:RNA polymerase sigma-70 factor (ECF subfamily)
MTGGKDSSGSDRRVASVSAAFVENSLFLKKYLARYFTNAQDIEDVAQETYLRAFAAEQKKHIEQPKAFLFRIAKNVALNELTRKSHQITDFIEDVSASIVLETAASAEEEVDAQESFGLYCEAVVSLPEKCRQVFLLRKVHGLAHKEIAARMSLSVSSVEKYLRQGVLTCRAFLDQKEGKTSVERSETLEHADTKDSY